MDILHERNMLVRKLGPAPSIGPREPGESLDQYRQRVDEWRRQGREREKLNLMNEAAADTIIYQIVQEMPQLASRLLVKNQDLYGKYDRQMAEASVRMNVSIPLTVLLALAVWLSDLSVWLRVSLTLFAVGFGYMLLRQGFLRAMSARDVVVQALVIGQVESRYIPSEESTDRPAERTPERKEPMVGELGDGRTDASSSQ
jgi:hypothetical protein